VRFDVKWRRPNEPEVLECHGLTADLLAFRIRAALRNYGRVDLLALIPTKEQKLMSTLTKEGEYRRLAMRHGDIGDEYAARSHEFEGELSDHYSSVAEAHHGLSAVFSKLAGEVPVDESSV
jgi:hypothetical protein